MSKSRNPTPPDQASLEKAALRYLERYASSAAGLRRVLMRRLRRAGADQDEEGEDRHAAIEAVIAKLMRLGLLDDARYAEARAGSLARRGASLFVIRRDLKARGIAAGPLDAAIGQLKDEAGGSSDAVDRMAALALARRRRLGPFRAPRVRAQFRDRDLATLGRAGFALEVARSVIDADSEDG
jgi:regulatory protein